MDNKIIDIFSTPENLHMLYYEQEEKTGSMCLAAAQYPVSDCPDFFDWFTDIDHSTKNYNCGLNAYIGLKTNVLSSRIAFKSRRSVGNIFFASNSDIIEAIKRDDILGKRIVPRKCVFIPEIPGDEIWGTYWKVGHNGKYIDGAIQFSPKGFHCIPTWKNYFLKIKI